MKVLITYLFAFLTAIFCCLSPVALAGGGEHGFSLHARVSGLQQREVYLLQLYGSKKTFVDSAAVNEQGEFAFTLPDITPNKEGVYSVILGQTAKARSNDDAPQSFDLIITPRETVLSTSFETPVDSMKVTTGMENQRYYAYLAKKKSSTQKLQILEKVLQIYPDDCSSKSTDAECFYKTLEKQYNGVQQELLSYTNGLAKKYPHAFFTKIALAEQYPVLDAAANGDKRTETLKEKFFKPGDFRDTLLLNSDVLTNKIMAYLGLYINKQYTGDQQVNEFIKAVDRMLPLAKAGDEKVYQYTLDYLLEGFNLVKADAVVAYITDHYLPESSCGIDDERIKEIVKKSEDYKRTAIGATAPEITFASPIIPRQVNEPKTLSDIHSGYTLLLFWASWCPHCTQILPELAKVYEEYKGKGLEVLAISLDVDSLKWKNTITEGKYNWLNYTDLKSWQSPAAQSYNIIATPTMFLLDKDKKIIAKPSTAQDLIHSLATKQF